VRSTRVLIVLAALAAPIAGVATVAGAGGSPPPAPAGYTEYEAATLAMPVPDGFVATAAPISTDGLVHVPDQNPDVQIGEPLAVTAPPVATDVTADPAPSYLPEGTYYRPGSGTSYQVPGGIVVTDVPLPPVPEGTDMRVVRCGGGFGGGTFPAASIAQPGRVDELIADGTCRVVHPEIENNPATTFDALAGHVGTGGAAEVAGQGPRDADLRLLDCKAYGAADPNARATVTAFSLPADVVAPRLADGTCRVVG
jgi:hypothetical protein